MKEHNYSYVFKFESEFNEQKAIAWITDHFSHAFYYDAIYLTVIFTLKKFMENRPPLKMKLPAVIWNIFLATFSIIGTSRTMPHLIHSMTHRGLHYTICDRSFLLTDPVTRVWAYFFLLSKIVELGDTVLVVLRKHPLITLHWTHHVMALTYCWWGYTTATSTARWLGTNNIFVHSLMYSYYALRCMNFKLPRRIPKMITTLQIVQMVIGVYANSYVLWLHSQGIECGSTSVNVACCLAMYFYFFVLFTRFYLKTYRSNNKKNHLKNN